MMDQKEFCHEIWLKCMQMNQCNQAEADVFLSKCRQYVNHSLTESNQTLLMVACSIGSLPIIKSCLKHGANVLLIDTVGRNALHYAASVGNIQIFELLISKGCDSKSQTIGGETPLSKACLFCQGDIIEWYLNNDLEAFQIPDNCQKKPLQVLKLSGQQLYEQVVEVYAQLKNSAI